MSWSSAPSITFSRIGTFMSRAGPMTPEARLKNDNLTIGRYIGKYIKSMTPRVKIGQANLIKICPKHLYDLGQNTNLIQYRKKPIYFLNRNYTFTTHTRKKIYLIGITFPSKGNYKTKNLVGNEKRKKREVKYASLFKIWPNEWHSFLKIWAPTNIQYII